MSRTARRLRVEGRVQGVFFRAWTVERARELGLDGWVRNRLDGSVEVLAAGGADLVDRLIALCHEGPPAARVDRVSVEETPGIIAPGFCQKPTV